MDLQLTDLSPYYRRLELVEQTAQQIIKDFGIHGQEITFSGNADTAYDELTSQIKPIIGELMDKEYEKFLSILYTIDLNEKTLAPETDGNTSDKQIDTITHLIIERELKKVVIQEHFRQNPES